jgi:hypothetical protein
MEGSFSIGERVCDDEAERLRRAGVTKHSMRDTRLIDEAVT